MGQDREVKILRAIAKDTIEDSMLDTRGDATAAHRVGSIYRDRLDGAFDFDKLFAK